MTSRWLTTISPTLRKLSEQLCCKPNQALNLIQFAPLLDVSNTRTQSSQLVPQWITMFQTSVLSTPKLKPVSKVLPPPRKSESTNGISICYQPQSTHRSKLCTTSTRPSTKILSHQHPTWKTPRSNLDKGWSSGTSSHIILSEGQL